MKKILYHSRNLITGVSPGYPLTNALKRVNKNLIVIDNIRRNNLFMSFTPQAYIFTKLLEAYNVIIDKKEQFSEISVDGFPRLKPVTINVPGDISSASFPIAAACMVRTLCIDFFSSYLINFLGICFLGSYTKK